MLPLLWYLSLSFFLIYLLLLKWCTCVNHTQIFKTHLCPNFSDWFHAYSLVNNVLHFKNCWVKYNPVLGKYWTEHMLGCFQATVGYSFNPTFSAVTQPLGLNNPIAGFVHILPSAGLYLTQQFLECMWTCSAFISPSFILLLEILYLVVCLHVIET